MIDIIIVNYNSTDYLLDCIRTVYRELEGFLATIWVEDNASTDGVHRVTEQFPDVVLTCNQQNLGFAAAVNRALRRSQSPYVILLNPDAYLLNGFFQKTISYLEKNSQVAILGPKILDEDGSIQGSARAFPTPLTALFGRSSLFTRWFPNNPISSANILTRMCDGVHPIEVDWVSGACMVVRRKAIQSAGYFDERFFMYWEDADWCRRMRSSGWKVIYYPLTTVVHHVGGSSNHLVTRSRFEFHKSVYLLFEKYNPASFWLVKLIVILGLCIRFCLVSISNAVMFYWNSKHSGRSTSATEIHSVNKIKILRMIARLNIGGPAIYVHLLTTGLDPDRFETILVTGMISHQEGDMSYLFQGDPIKPFLITELQRDISVFMDIRVMYRIFQILRCEHPDIVDTHTAKAGFTARLTVWFYNLVFNKQIKIVHTFHGHVFEGYFSAIKSYLFVQIERCMAMFTDVIIAISETQRKDLIEKYHIASPHKIRMIALGFDLSPFFSCTRLKGQFRSKLGVNEKTILIGIIGRLVPIKNHKMFLDAARLYLTIHPETDVKFIAIGDGECRSLLEQYCREMNLVSNVIFCGWIQDIAQVYADLNILALTSLNEGTPVSIIEAMAAAVPVIATQVGGIRDLMGEVNDFAVSGAYQICDRGIVCRNNDSDGFAKGLAHIVFENRSNQEKRVRRAQAYVGKKYVKERLVKDMELLYSQLVQE